VAWTPHYYYVTVLKQTKLIIAKKANEGNRQSNPQSNINSSSENNMTLVKILKKMQTDSHDNL